MAKAGVQAAPYDLPIAGRARRRGAFLVTAGTGEFARVPGPRAEDPRAEDLRMEDLGMEDLGMEDWAAAQGGCAAGT